MDLYIAGLLLALAHFADLAEGYDANRQVDILASQLNDGASYLASSLHLPPYTVDNIKLEEQVLYGLNSLRRIGEAEGYFNASEQTEHLDFRVGYGMLALAFGKLTRGDEPSGSGVVRISDTSIHVTYTIVQASQERCSITFDSRVERIRNITLHSTDPELDGRDLSEYEQKILGSANFLNFFATKALQGAFEELLCTRT